MEALKNFEWVRDAAGYRLAWQSKRAEKAYWVQTPEGEWADTYPTYRKSPLQISTTQYFGEKRVPKRGIYAVGQRQWLGNKEKDELWHAEIIRPFNSDEIISLNILQLDGGLEGYFYFVNKYGFIGRGDSGDRWFASGEEKIPFIAQAEHEGEWHQLRNALFRIYEYYPAIQRQDSSFLKRFIFWDSKEIVREDIGLEFAKTKIAPAIAMRGTFNTHYFDIFDYPDVLVPAAMAISNSVNHYLKNELSLQISFDPKSSTFTSSLHFASLGAAIVAEAVEVMAGRLEAKACTVCGSWFRVGEDHKRRDRRFCSAACKMRDYRSRKLAVRRPR